MVRRSSVLLPPVALPLLVAVGALLGPVAASAGDPAPDPPTAVRAPAPDAPPASQSAMSAPARAPVTHAVHIVAAPAPRVVSPLPRPSLTHVKRAVHQGQKHVVRAEAPILDVPPLQVDVHRGLGAVAPSLRDDSLALLAGIALLVAAAVATAGLALTLVAARAPRSAT
jgi:hypothetical protein